MKKSELVIEYARGGGSWRELSRLRGVVTLGDLRAKLARHGWTVTYYGKGLEARKRGRLICA